MARRLGSWAEMDVRELAVPGCFEFLPRQHVDDRGSFQEWFRADLFAVAVGHHLEVAQANHSVSRQGTLRGIHYALVPPGQGKYVYCPRGAVLDVVVDLRVGSPTFGDSAAVVLDEVDRRAVYLPEGIGHAFVALAEDTALTYLCSTGYNPEREKAVDALDPDLALPWPAELEAVRSERDQSAPSLAAAGQAGHLPRYAACTEHYDLLRRGGQ